MLEINRTDFVFFLFLYFQISNRMTKKPVSNRCSSVRHGAVRQNSRHKFYSLGLCALNAPYFSFARKIAAFNSSVVILSNWLLNWMFSILFTAFAVWSGSSDGQCSHQDGMVSRISIFRWLQTATIGSATARAKENWTNKNWMRSRMNEIKRTM